MNSLQHSSRLRAVALWLLGTAALVALLGWLGADASARPTATFDGVLVQGCRVAAGLCAIWAWIVTGVVVLEILRRSPDPSPGVPAWARRVVLMACGVAVVGLAAPAGAVGPAEVDLDGLPMPDRATGGFLAQTIGPQLRARTTPPPAPGSEGRMTHVVAAGESLWTISDAELEDPARWVEIYDLNRARIGPDADLIDINQRLDLPHR